jgi:hypothetical protein
MPALALPVILSQAAVFGAAMHASVVDIAHLAKQLSRVTSYTYGGKPAIRITGTFACVGGRNPYPKPGQAGKDRRAC